MKQHHVPRSYLQGWVVEGKVVRVRRVGPQAGLEVRRCAPKGILWEKDLYTLPPGCTANGRKGTELEAELGAGSDARIRSLAEKVLRNGSGWVDEELARAVLSLMRTLSARTPESLARVEEGVRFVQDEIAPALNAVVARERAHADEACRKLAQYLDPRYPAGAARAALAEVHSVPGSPVADWLDGEVRLVTRADVEAALSRLGLSGFPTFDRPVVDWEQNSTGLLATLAIGPDMLVAAFPRGQSTARAPFDPDAVAGRHAIEPLRFRHTAVLNRKPASGSIWERVAAESLLPR